MKGVFIGTGAADFIHTTYCTAGNCLLARKMGGKSLRGSASFLLEQRYLLDAGWSVFDAVKKGDLNIAKLQYIIITHGHNDHFVPQVVAFIALEREKMGLEPPLLIGNHKVLSAMQFYLSHRKGTDGRIEGCVHKASLAMKEAKPFENINLERFGVLPLPANHSIFYSWHDIYGGEEVKFQDRWPIEGDLLLKQEDAYNYIISYEEKELFYGLDSAWPLPETMAELKKHSLAMAVLDSTFGFLEEHPSGHMNFKTLSELVQELSSSQVLAGEIFASHLSLHFAPVHDEAAAWLGQKGIHLAFDGLEVEF